MPRHRSETPRQKSPVRSLRISNPNLLVTKFPCDPRALLLLSSPTATIEHGAQPPAVAIKFLAGPQAGLLPAVQCGRRSTTSDDHNDTQLPIQILFRDLAHSTAHQISVLEPCLISFAALMCSSRSLLRKAQYSEWATRPCRDCGASTTACRYGQKWRIDGEIEHVIAFKTLHAFARKYSSPNAPAESFWQKLRRPMLQHRIEFVSNAYRLAEVRR